MWLKTSNNQYAKGLIQSLLLLAMMLLFITGSALQSFGSGGSIIWQAADVQNGQQLAKASATDSQGSVIITGYQNLGGYDSYYTTKFKSDGSGVQWRATFVQGGGNCQATAVVTDSSDNVIVTGTLWNGVNNDIHTIKYSGSDGAVLWQHTWNGSANGNDRATAVAIDNLNNVYVGGSSQGASGTDDFTIIKYLATGPVNNAPAWQASYNGPANGMDNLYDLTVGVNGIAVTGWSYTGSSFDMLTSKYDLSGNRLWEVRYPAIGGAMGKKVRMDAAGNVIASGYAADAGSKNIYTAKYRSSDGSKLWERSYSSPDNSDEESNDLYVDSSSEVFVTGYTFLNGGLKKVFYTARYSGSTGAVVWDATSNSGGDADEAVAITVDGVGDVYVTGYTVSAGNYDFLTIKYRRDSGIEQWSLPFNGSAGLNDRPVGISVSANGQVLVGGWSEAGSANPDYFALKLDPEQLPRPTGLAAATLSNNSIQLAWSDNSANEESFRVERKLGESGSYSEVATLAANTTGYTDIGLNINNTYYYRVRAYNTLQGFSHYSNDAHALTASYNNIAFARSVIYNGADNQNDFPSSIAIGPDENPVITGYSQTAAFGNNYATIKLNRSDLSTIWSSQYDDPDSGTDEALCLAVDANNNTIVSGHANLYYSLVGRNIPSILTLKYPAIGPPESWTKQYNGPGGIDDRPRAVAASVDAASNVAVVGYGLNSAENIDIYVLKYSKTGALVWAANPFDGPGHGNDIPSAAAFGPDGSIYVTGYSETATNSGRYKFFTAKYNAASGAIVWSDLYSVQPTGDNRGNSIVVDAAGDVYVTGRAGNESGNTDIYTIKYSGSSSTVQRLWERTFDGAAHGDDNGVSIKIDPYDGAIVVAGTTLTSSGNNDFMALRYSSAGDLLWQKTVLRPNNDDTLTGLAIDPSGTIYLAGDTSNAATVDILSVIIDSTGNILAYSVYDGAGHSYDQAIGVVADSKGEAFIGGSTVNASGNADYIVLKQSSSNYIIPIPTPFAASQQADYSRINLTWSNNQPGSSFRIERTPGPVSAGSSWALINTVAPGVTSFMDSGLNPGTNYCYRIEAFSGTFSSRQIISCATTTLPQPELNLTLVSATAIDLNWTNIPGNSGYKLERSTDNSSWSQLGANLPSDTTVYHDTNLVAGQVYYYRISTLSSSGASLATLQIAPVLGSAIAVSSTEIDLSWPAINGATAYVLERSIDSATWAQVVSQGATGYQNISLTPGITYYYRLKVVSVSGTSLPSLVRTAQSWPTTPVLNSVTALSASQTSLSWTSAAGATGYSIWQAACNNSWTTWSGYYTYNPTVWNPVPISPNNCDTYPQYIGWSPPALVSATGQGVTTFDKTGLGGGTYYRYYIVATAATSSSPGSNSMKAWTPVAVPVLSATTTDTAVTLNWSYANGWTGSTLERSLDGVTGWTAIKTNSSSSNAYSYTSFTDAGRTPATTYYYRVTVSGVVGAPAVSPVLPVTTKPGGPAITAVTLSNGQITATWNSLADVTGYEVQLYYSSDSTATPSYYNQTGQPVSVTQTQYTLTNPNPGWAYKFQVRGKFADTTSSGWGSDSGLWKRTPPAIPTNIYANSPYVYYSSTGATSYSLQYMQPSGSDCSAGTAWTTLAASTAATSYSIPASGLTAYCFKASASNESGSSSLSSAAIYLPPPTTFTLGTATVSTIPLTWSTVPGNNGYQIERYPYYYGCYNPYPIWVTNCGPIWTTAANTAPGATSFIDSGLISNYTYQYRISTRFSGGQSAVKLSAPASKATLALGNMTLTGLTVDSSSRITLTWADVTGNNGYKIQRSLDNVAWTDIVTTDPGSTSFTNTDLNSGTKYYYRGQARDGAGTFTAISNVLNGTTPLPTPVITSAAAASESRIDLTWQVVQGATNYKLLHSIGPNGPWTQIANQAISYATLYCGKYPAPNMDCSTLIPTYATYADAGLTENTNYCYQVKAWNTANGDSSASPTVCANTLSLGGPTLTAVTASLLTRTVQLNWTYNPATCSPTPCAPLPDGFEIWRLAMNGEWVLAATTANVTTFTDRTNIEPLKTYSYKIRAFKGVETSNYSNILGSTTAIFNSNAGTCP